MFCLRKQKLAVVRACVHGTTSVGRTIEFCVDQSQSPFVFLLTILQTIQCLKGMDGGACGLQNKMSCVKYR